MKVTDIRILFGLGLFL